MIFLLIIALFCGLNMCFVGNFTLKGVFPEAQVEVYTASKTNLKNKIDNGMGEIVFDSIQNLNELHNQIDDIQGFTIKIKGQCVERVLKKLKVTNCFSENNSIYGRSQYFKRGVVMNSLEVNFQIVQKGDCVLVGSPIILGDY